MLLVYSFNDEAKCASLVELADVQVVVQRPRECPPVDLQGVELVRLAKLSLAPHAPRAGANAYLKNIRSHNPPPVRHPPRSPPGVAPALGKQEWRVMPGDGRSPVLFGCRTVT
ncbi:MAG: hypothetical protein ACYTDW_03125 [Planctomycetota bacterium]